MRTPSSTPAPGMSNGLTEERPETPANVPCQTFTAEPTPVVLTVPADGALAARTASLDATTVALLSAGVPANTRRAYAAGRRAWSAWCPAMQVPVLPPAPGDLARYAALLLTVGSPVVTQARPLSSSTVEGHLSAVSTWAVEQGHPRPDLRAARLVLRGNQRSGGDRPPGRAAPITVDILRRLVAQATLSRRPDGSPTMRALRDRAVLLLGFALGARRSELVAIDMEHVVRVPQGLAVTVWRAKTRTSSDVVAVPVAVDPDLCPVRATLSLRQGLHDRGHTTGPLFRPVSRTDTVLTRRLGGDSVADIVGQLAAAAGVEVPEGFRGFSAHSLRRGMATEMRRAGADALSISRQGGWSPGSTALAGYLEDLDRWTDHGLSRVL